MLFLIRAEARRKVAFHAVVVIMCVSFVKEKKDSYYYSLSQKPWCIVLLVAPNFWMQNSALCTGKKMSRKGVRCHGVLKGFRGNAVRIYLKIRKGLIRGLLRMLLFFINLPK